MQGNQLALSAVEVCQSTGFEWGQKKFADVQRRVGQQEVAARISVSTVETPWFSKYTLCNNDFNHSSQSPGKDSQYVPDCGRFSRTSSDFSISFHEDLSLNKIP